MTKNIVGYSAIEWKAAGVLGVVGAIGLAYLIGSRGPAEASNDERKARAEESKMAAARGSALMNCQRALKQASRDPATAVVPAVAPLNGGADWRFLWAPHTEPVRMRNGLGLEVAVGALCVIDEATGTVKMLTLDGKHIVAPSPRS